ncbi:hypothetical protein TWF506_000432 [Arthrobotrys conoides]|uniref:Uncharacterized protein n=1 Tax=Arthrobotrys conoides TaxID=74498 RepID=A0AAN8NFP2_9PEZI
MVMATPSEARVFLGPGGRDNLPHDQPDTISFYFPFAVSDAILIFTNIVVPGPDPFSVSEESRREVFWPLIKRITNYPKAVDPVLAKGSMEIGDQVEALMESLNDAFNSGVKNVYINCAGTLVGVSASLMHQFLELSEKVFHLWKNRNDAARPDEPGSQGDGNKAPAAPSSAAALTRPEKPSSSTPTPLLSHLPPKPHSSISKPHFPSLSPTAELDSRPIHSVSAPLGMASSSSSKNANGGRESREFISPFIGAGAGAGAGARGDPETPAARQARIDEHTLQQQLLASHAQTLAAQSQQSQQQLSQVDPTYQSATSQWLSSGAGKVPISEIWRATIYRLYNEQNESLTKYRRPNWLFHLESHAVRTIEDLGGWREDDESTRQLANNLITKLQETGYGTKGLQSRLKAIITADIRDAILNVERGGLEKYKPGPTLGKRVNPIKWSHVNPSDLPGQHIMMMELDSPTDTPGPHLPVGITPELSGTTNEVENSLKRSTDSSAHPIRIKRKRTSSPNRESLTLVMPLEMADEKEGQQSARKGAPTAPAPVAPMMRPDATPQTGFTPININRSVGPAVSSVSTPAPIAPAPIAPAPAAPVATVIATPTPVPVHHHMNTTATPPNLATPSSATRLVDVRPFAEAPQRPATPSSTIDLESEQDDDDYDASMMDELVYKRLQYLKTGLESLRQELAESKQSQADNASIIEKAAKEVFDGFTRDFHEDYRRVRNLSKENKERFDKFEAKLGSVGDIGNTKEELEKLEAKLTEDVKNLVTTKIMERDNHLAERIDAQRLDFINEQEKRSNDEAELEQRFAKLEDKLSTLDSDVNTRFQMLENPVPAPVITTSTRRATRNSVSAPSPPVSVLTTETRLRLDKIEARLDKLETQQRKVTNSTASNPIDLERIAALEDKHKALESNLTQVMEAVSGLLIQVMKEKRGSVSVFDDKKN